MKRRNFLAGSCCSFATVGIPTRPAVAEEKLDFSRICMSNISERLTGLQVQSANDQEIDELGFGDDDAAKPIATDWQGVARKDLVWRPQDVRLVEGGVMKLAVGFVHNPSDAFKRNVQNRALNWMKSDAIRSKIVFVFDRPLEECEIRVAQGGRNKVARVNVSIMGRQAKDYRLKREIDPSGQATMVVTDSTSVEHEFGHVLGLGHEATHPVLIRQIDMDAAINFFAKPPNKWPAAVTRENFTPGLRCDGDTRFNAASVMLYELPGEITKIGSDLYNFNTIHSRDYQCAASLYK